ncbi:hypothetical protein M422DRAFT_266734 [Sphaerobolus stellatus SS14]|uniref:Uncharacterized protein n=1 Tax=Sphaerobolus stellatus (strain SS14) TaxID=990650 RepID=A0A0C9TNJ1_SPHS4|nr:hypothetical protein M422DRAFT_266734 [Sphaerobolus stellatus SS14]
MQYSHCTPPRRHQQKRSNDINGRQDEENIILKNVPIFNRIFEAIERVQSRGQDCVDKGLLFITFNEDGKLCNGGGNAVVMIQGSPKRAVSNVSAKVAIFHMAETYEFVELTLNESPRENILGVVNLEGDTVKNIKRLSIQVRSHVILMFDKQFELQEHYVWTRTKRKA